MIDNWPKTNKRSYEERNGLKLRQGCEVAMGLKKAGFLAISLP